MLEEKKTTQGTFGEELHSYIITNALRDDKVLKFKGRLQQCYAKI